MKVGEEKALDCAALSMIPLIPRHAVLVPVPGHEGKAKQTLQVCRAISSYTGLPVGDVLQGKSRESNYVAKHEGKGLTEKDMGFRKVAQLPDGRIPVYVDNVVDTGTTAKAAQLKKQVVALSLLAAGKIIENSMNQAESERLVNSFVMQLDESKIGELTC